MSMRLLRNLVFLLIIFGSHNVSAERVFSETQLNIWGYETVEIEETHKIKSIDNKSETGSKFYARFSLWKQCFETSEEAALEVKERENDVNSVPGAAWKDYKEVLHASECIYFVNTNSRAVHLSYQPKLMNLIEEYVQR